MICIKRIHILLPGYMCSVCENPMVNSMLFILQSMFDLIYSHGGRLDIKNRQGLTPLTLAAKLARKDVSVILRIVF